MEAALEMSFPGTDVEIEIALSMVSFRRGRLRLCFRRAWLRF
jgi:hypothetical protein